MASRLLKAIDTRIAKTRDPLENTCLRAERAALLARQGRLEEARAELTRIHARFDSRPNARVSAWTSLAEGLVMFHGNLGLEARDKLLRACALGTAAGDQGIRALSAAWLAHFAYLDQNLEAMVRNLEIALNEAPRRATSTLTRACLVAAQGYHWADRFDIAQRWYASTRQYATHDGDETVLSALMHNMAWLRASQARRLAVSGGGSEEQIRSVLLGAESADSFDKRVGTSSLLSLVPTLRAHVLTLLGRYADALELFTRHFDAALSEGLGTNQCAMLAEIAWCRLNVGDATGASDCANAALNEINSCSQPDERAATHGRLAQLFAALGSPSLGDSHRAQALLDWSLHSSNQRLLLSLLTTRVPNSPPGP